MVTQVYQYSQSSCLNVRVPSMALKNIAKMKLNEYHHYQSQDTIRICLQKTGMKSIGKNSKHIT